MQESLFFSLFLFHFGGHLSKQNQNKGCLYFIKGSDEPHDDGREGESKSKSKFSIISRSNS